MEVKLILDVLLVLAGVLVCGLHASTDCNSREDGGTCQSMDIEKVGLCTSARLKGLVAAPQIMFNHNVCKVA